MRRMTTGEPAPWPRPAAVAVGLLLMLAASGAVHSQPATPDSGSEADAEQQERTRYIGLLQKKLLLEREASLKTLQLQLAEDEAPYLVFDLEAKEVRVYVRVTSLRSLPLEQAEMEVLATDGDSLVAAPAWVDRQLDLVAKSGDGKAPERVEPPAEPREAAEDFNPRAVTPETAGLKDPEYPTSYTLLFRQGVAIHVMGGSAKQNGGGTWVQERIERLASLLIRPDLPAAEEMQPVHTWIHLTLPEEEARILYPIAYAGMRAMIRLPGDPVF
jgi:hypothetical protein